MIDNYNPNNQFHPYQPSEAVPHAERPAGGLNDMIRSARGYAQRKPGAVLGGLAALVIGAGLMRRRRM
jgi:hypothetical protein